MSCKTNQEEQFVQDQSDEIVEELEDFRKKRVELFKQQYPDIDNEEVFSLLCSCELEDKLKAYALCLNEEAYLRGRGLIGGKKVQSCRTLIQFCESLIAQEVLKKHGWCSALVSLYYQKKPEGQKK